MKLLAVVPTGELSGAERVLLRYLGAAAEAGVHVRCLVPPGRCADALAAAGITTLPLPALDVPTGPRAVGLARLAGRWRAAARAVRAAAVDADAVLVNGFLALPVVRMARIAPPVAWLVHDVVRKPEWRLLMRVCAPAVTTAFAVSDGAAGPVRAAGIPARVVRNGTVWPVEPARPGPGVPVVGVNAALTSWKGQDVLLEAVARLDVPVHVELMGGRFAKDAPFADALRERAARPDLAGRVRFVGHVADPLARMRTWTVAVSSSVGPEAAPLNVLEAMSLGLPMVATGHGGTVEVLGGAGLLVPPGDPAALAAALRRLLTEPDLHARCAAAGPTAVAAGLRLEDAVEDFLLALASLTPPTPPARRPASVATEELV
jgi:glycosyltransferase involved in cell wall biosynthesis